MASDFLGGALRNDALQLFSDHFAEELSVSEGSRRAWGRDAFEVYLVLASFVGGSLRNV